MTFIRCNLVCVFLRVLLGCMIVRISSCKDHIRMASPWCVFCYVWLNYTLLQNLSCKYHIHVCLHCVFFCGLFDSLNLRIPPWINRTWKLCSWYGFSYGLLLLDCENLILQTSHSYGLTPVCFLLCTARWPEEKNGFWQTSLSWCLFRVCVLKCINASVKYKRAHPPGQTPRLLKYCDNLRLLPRGGDEIHVKMPCCGAENP
jgi:hypothetical protein